MKKEKLVYVEPADYFSEETRKKYGLGEYAKPKHPQDDNELVKIINDQMDNSATFAELTTPTPIDPEDE